MPSGFDPVSFTAISADQFWLLGDARCGTSRCTSIVRSTDGGRHFAGIPAPRVPLTRTDDTGMSIDTLRFATPHDGFAFDAQSFPRADSPSDPLWETRDGGGHWQRVHVGDVRAFATGGGYVFLVTADCHAGVCHNPMLERATLGKNDWRSSRLPVGAFDSTVSLAVHGASVWISVSATAGVHQNQILLASTDNGTSFTIGTSPCSNGLGGELEPTSGSVIWAVCPTGMLAAALRSTDGGAHWSSLNIGRGLSNGARIAPASDSTAVVATGDQAQLRRTTDGGATFTQVFPTRAGWWNFIGFTDAATGSGLRLVPGESRSSLGPPLSELMRSDDGGASWTAVIVR